MEDEYISIMEFADLANVSLPDLFGEVLRGSLDGLYKEIDRNTYISIKALSRYQKAPESQPEEETPAPEIPPEMDDKESYINSLLEQLEEAKRTITEKDNQIQELSAKLAEMAVKSQEIADKALNTIHQQQILTAMTARKLPWYKRLLNKGSNDYDNR